MEFTGQDNNYAQQQVWQKTGLTKRNINFCLATQLLFSARRYKFGNRHNNELLIINLAAVRAGRISNTSSSPSLFVVRNPN